ncbi:MULTISPECIES: sigma-54 interaction domain-containing protein [unclassified Romboutsia]|uniref:sigma-54 interaction domain-containing protein n=1 Tax=unclassified Romboutsia TaxID=2626894 RepID=UPI0018985490|nr:MULTISPECIES: sigma 54-interacting transcriptional regulator [unclassified Romboutsia]MDB8805347.1 sigma 54-interacting transcriptional regulator [Romboutsia sp. 1001216sp1]MDB8806979.1 sigma 54-interacting transcriptional regulator [Romboutsia sp. 1001216sp1]MDB8810992.1 sigma 54-interacting transcriptional regulator [Romboutsia sp. 1001216sp1]MDB8816712.1 sigma 54-interacting transcriptional regulator [Romboutsia sp. 1001216sp1]MDB8819003.1 sigma 54-interacting transcriptional regulator [
MANLKYIREDIQNIAEAIVAVLGIDVTIVDDDLTRVAGTGIYLEKIGEKISGYSAFNKCLIEQIEIIIDDPSCNDICNECSNSGDCKEFAEVCCPIISEGVTYGVIGLIAFTEEQAKVIKNNKDVLMNFLGKMADLISNKIKAQVKAYELELEKKKLETLVNGIDKAIVSIDVDGNIDKYNLKFKKVFNLENNINGKNIFKLLEFIKKPSRDNFKKEKSHSFNYKLDGYELKGIYNINEIILKKELKGYVIDFIDNKDAIKNYNKINKDYSITLENIIGNSSIINSVKKEALIASKSTSTVLITGESGTGKELFARAIHNHSNRCENPFVAVNCAAIPDNLLESELFGYEEGAFTGAKKGGKLGKFEIANKGTIFLDEIGDMSLHLQAKLLRVLQEKELNKIGAKSNKFIDVRIIAATNKDLEKMVLKGTFREDLYYRLNVIPISLPNLRQRKDDIPDLIDFMIKEYSRKLEKHVTGIDKNVLDVMLEYKWPGNIRELQNIIEYGVNMSIGEIITLDVIPNKLKNVELEEVLVQNDKIRTLEELEKAEIIKALHKYKDYKKDKELVAKSLGISRATLYRKLEKYKIISK